MRTERVKIVRYVRCGMTSSNGTDKGKLRKVGSRAVKIGIDRSRFDGWCWNRTHTSFVFSMIVRDVIRKEKLDSRRKASLTLPSLLTVLLFLPFAFLRLALGVRLWPWSIRSRRLLLEWR